MNTFLRLVIGGLVGAAFGVVFVDVVASNIPGSPEPAPLASPRAGFLLVWGPLAILIGAALGVAIAYSTCKPRKPLE
jgi:hypothetical protein